MRLLVTAIATALVAILPLSVRAQEAPSYAVPNAAASTDEQVHGRIISFDGAYDVRVDDERGFVDRVRLHDGTIINPTGLTLAPGMVVSVLGYNAGGFFSANEIDTPYTSYDGGWYYRDHPYDYYGSSIGLSFFFGDIGWWHGNAYRGYGGYDGYGRDGHGYGGHGHDGHGYDGHGHDGSASGGGSNDRAGSGYVAGGHAYGGAIRGGSPQTLGHAHDGAGTHPFAPSSSVRASGGGYRGGASIGGGAYHSATGFGGGAYHGGAGFGSGAPGVSGGYHGGGAGVAHGGGGGSVGVARGGGSIGSAHGGGGPRAH